MKITESILAHPLFRGSLERNGEDEKDRVYCHHDFQHCLDVARVAYCMILEKNLPLEKDIIYATALLHDLGKWKQYESGLDHALQGANLAGIILGDIGVEEKISLEIQDAIRTHRDRESKKSLLGEILYASDKACRPCLFCKSLEDCKRFAEGRKPLLQY
ncbi:HD domain-containing protein [uncultured Sphaerochaeta sp.]|uniref:HD domain-containing protein n=1 Tax=uncultured Sphaerochaeta sp. TaxID=886478 RepID=UPI002A0A46B3|nr:HD domain-containing protein [uncultured Sphaerochaeta sp.]